MDIMNNMPLYFFFIRNLEIFMDIMSAILPSFSCPRRGAERTNAAAATAGSIVMPQTTAVLS